MSQKILFFGSGPVAADSLRLLARDFDVEAVITKPQPAHHKTPFPVLALCEELGLQVHTAGTQEETSDLFTTNSFESKLGVIIDHGLMVSQSVIDYFPLGIVNSHFSLLPKWRGADPISFSILHGDQQTGVSLMIIVHALDEGDLIAQQSIDLDQNITTPKLTEQLIGLSHEMLVDSLPKYASGELQPYPQPDEEPTYSHKLSKQDSTLDFSRPAVDLERQVRAYTGWPRSRTKIKDTDIIVTEASVAEGQGEIGALFTEEKQLGFYTCEGILLINKLIPAGKKEMTAESFLAGYQI